jgi:hypothetical protein
MSKVIGIFATRNDLLDLLADVESARSVQYAEAGMFDKPAPATFGSSSEIPGLGTTHATSTNLAPRFLLADAGVPFSVRPVLQRKGGTRYAVDQQKNPDSVALIPGGQFDGQTLLAGSIGTCTNSAVSAALLGAIASVIRRKWVKIQSYAVGPEAARVLDAGGRLTADIWSPREYDLQR